MHRLNCSRLSDRFQVRELTESDIPAIYALCCGNRLFYECCGRQNTPEEIRNDMTITPPGKDLCDKYYVGFFDGTHLAAVMDLIDGYPDDETAFIGFFMLHVAYQGKGTGTAMISRVCAYLKQAGFRRVQLGFDKENPQSSHFWLKNRFAAVREVPQEKGIIVLAERSL